MSGADVPISEFDRATAVRPRPGSTEHDVEVDAGWCIGDKPNGGYLLALLARAVLAGTAAVEGPDHPHALSASATYVASPDPGPAVVETEVLRRGRAVSQARGRLVRDGSVFVDALVTAGRLTTDAAPWWSNEPAPEATPYADCQRSPASGGAVTLSLMERIELRLDPQTTGFASGRPSGRGELRGWLSFADGRAPDPLALLLALDALPPATLDLGTEGWVPTIALSAFVRAVPAPGPLLVRQRARLVEADTVDELCEVWDQRGRLVAHATQLAGVRTP